MNDAENFNTRYTDFKKVCLASVKFKQVNRKNLKSINKLHAANQLQTDDICDSSPETNFIENIEEMLLYNVCEKRWRFFGQLERSLGKYHDQSLLFSRQERTIVNVLQFRRSPVYLLFSVKFTIQLGKLKKEY